jgi:hypothetical protein
MVYLTFHECRKATLRGRRPAVETPHAARRVLFSAGFLNAPRHHTHVRQMQRPKVLIHQRRATADVIIHEDDSFVLCVPPPKIPGCRKTPEVDATPLDDLAMLHYQLL